MLFWNQFYAWFQFHVIWIQLLAFMIPVCIILIIGYLYLPGLNGPTALWTTWAMRCRWVEMKEDNSDKLCVCFLWNRYWVMLHIDLQLFIMSPGKPEWFSFVTRIVGTSVGCQNTSQKWRHWWFQLLFLILLCAWFQFHVFWIQLQAFMILVCIILLVGYLFLPRLYGWTVL